MSNISGAKGDIGWPGPMGVVGIRGINLYFFLFERLIHFFETRIFLRYFMMQM